MAATVKYFMWGYQPHLRISLNLSAESIFGVIDAALSPTVFLVGFRQEQSQEYLPICIEPDDYHYQPDVFAQVPQLADVLKKTGKETVWLHNSEAVAKKFEINEHRSYLRDALQITIDQRTSVSRRSSFCSRPELVNGYLVFVVLQVNKMTYERHYRLGRDHQIGERESYSQSLVDSLIQTFLRAASKALCQPDPGADSTSLFHSVAEALRIAGNSLMYAPASAGHNSDGLHGLFNVCNDISSLKYEGGESTGKLLIARREHPDIDVIIPLSTPVPLRLSKAVRKLLEISDGSLALLSDSATVYGLGSLAQTYNAAREDAFLVEFVGHHRWRLNHAEATMMEVNFGEPCLPKPRLMRNEFEILLSRIFGEIGAIDRDNLWRLVDTSIDQRRGTMLIISEGAQKEAMRLASQCTGVVPITLTPELMRLVTRIDGAVLVDLHSTCYAIGAILDGIASIHGTPSRGARYNSAIRYVDTTTIKTVAVVVSEDGYVNLIPNLKPQIRRSEIEKMIFSLQEIKAAERLELKPFWKSLDWLDKNRFYLSQEMCDEINATKSAIYARKESEDPTSWSIIYDDFKANDEMNESYFVLESNRPIPDA